VHVTTARMTLGFFDKFSSKSGGARAVSMGLILEPV
jgi:hypothetical protein